MVASALSILTLAFERCIMVEASLKSQEYLIHSHLRMVIIYIWLFALCVALLSLLNRCNEAEYRLIITDAIGFPKWLKIGEKFLKILNYFFETFLLHRPKQFRKLNIQSKSRDLTVAYNDILAPFLSSCFGR